MAPTPIPVDETFLKRIFIHHLNRIYNGKCFLRNKLNDLKDLASFKSMQFAIDEFGDDVVKQISRMDKVYALIGEQPVGDGHNPIKSIISDQFYIDEEQDIPVLKDLDLMLYIQLLEHVNITSFRMLIMIGNMLNYEEAVQLLTENFDESKDNDKLFVLIAKEYITKE